MPQIESLLSARLFLTPQLVGGRIYFLSNLSGRLSLYAMDATGSVPESLLPPQIALQNPHLIGGHVFSVFPKCGRILVMIDQDGDENYQPMIIPLDGGVPSPAFGDALKNYRVHFVHADADANLAYFNAESRLEPVQVAYQGYLPNYELRTLASSPWGAFVAGVNADHTRAIILDGYTAGDTVMFEWTDGQQERRLLLGTPLEARSKGQEVPLTSFGSSFYTADDRGLLFTSSLFSDTYGLTYLPLNDQPALLDPELEPAAMPAPAADVAAGPVSVTVVGAVHTGAGELDSLAHLRDNRYLVGYNIDGCSWQYEGTFDEAERRMTLERVLVGSGRLANGVLESIRYDRDGDRYAISYSTATSPTQMYTMEGSERQIVRQLTRESVLGLGQDHLAPGEDASFTSFDGTRISARLYLPAPALRFEGPRPLVYYVHGGPQGQERPDFAWFSMPLIQFLTLNGFAVFVPNVRGSTGYGLTYTKQVDRDWGGKDRLDHVHAMKEVLPADPRLDVRRAAVVGRSYGGYMTLTLASRHPELWRGAVDMFGPYDLIRFMEVIPETWKPYFKLVLGDPEQDHEFLVERSPRTYIDNIRCPMLVIQGMNDPRVRESESRAVVEGLRAQGKQVDFLVFENEGHDVLKFENRVTCYNAITDFFKQHLG
jgi:pimeloyl-ACP methyl ester carboxylesterase